VAGRTAKWLAAVGVGILCQLAVMCSSEAQNAFERLIMPGKLSEPHAKLEQDCGKCHQPFSQQGQNALCASCHKDVARDLAEKIGFHGKRPEIASKDCRFCHTEHKGREADIVRFDRASFDHETTNFKLEGRHARTDCGGCHLPGKKFREAKSDCVDCHKAASPHREQLGERCQDCHATTGWVQVKSYDHAKTKFPLTGSHQDVTCKSCHAGERWRGVAVECVSCHLQQDVHKTRNGAKCEECHSTRRWADVRFDHDAQTKFPLMGKHRGVECGKCHVEDPHRVKPATACVACHKKDDAHKGQLGEQCVKCHGEGGWKSDVKFDHAVTRFPLKGKHADAKCEDCHKSRAYKEVPLTCSGCHSDAKSHDGRLGSNCATCHAPNTWKQARFDHSTQTKFKLVGRHATATCYSCHATRHVTRATLSTDCYTCHKSQDRHQGAFGRDCGKCHTPTTFGVAYIKK
jgi:hypothetical protein